MTVENTEKYPFYGQATINNGIISYESLIEDVLNNKKGLPTILVHSNNQNVVYVETPFYLKDGHGATSVLQSIKLNKTNALFLMAAISSVITKAFSYNYKATKIALKNSIIQLPLKEKSLDFSNPCDNIKNIDFDFMESFIRELEEERIRELEEERIRELNAYLLATGLKDYALSAEEEKALEAFKTVKWGEFELPEIFDIKNTHNILSSEIVAESGTTPYLCASAENNGVSSYISYKNELLENGNCIFIGGKTFVVSYQKDNFYSNDSHNLALYLKEQNVTKSNQLYLATCIHKSLSHKYSWGNSISGSKIKSDKFQLPTKNNKPDYATMETFIEAVEKLVIKDVVLYADSKIKATENVVKRDLEYKINEDAGLLNVADKIN